MTVIVARADDAFSQRFRDAGIEVIDLELIRAEVLEDLSRFENVIANLDEFDGVFFTSPVAAEVFAGAVTPPVRPKLYCLGKRAAAVLELAGFESVTFPDANTAADMLAGLDGTLDGRKLLFVRGERSMRTIPDALAGRASVTEVVVYRTVEASIDPEMEAEVRSRLSRNQVEWLCLFSPSAVEAFEKTFGPRDVSVAAIGETTASRARELGFGVDLIASRASNDVFADELIGKIRGNKIV